VAPTLLSAAFNFRACRWLALDRPPVAAFHTGTNRLDGRLFPMNKLFFRGNKNRLRWFTLVYVLEERSSPASFEQLALPLFGRLYNFAHWLAQSREENNLVQDNLVQQSRIAGELADLHVTTLASANPVDVVSSHRHNVNPWFAGKIPFSFDLPELQGSQFELVGGKVSYVEQSPGAQLLFRVRKHQISVFIFQSRALPLDFASTEEINARSFHLESWRRNGLQYFAISDVAPEDLRALSYLLKK